MLAALVGSGLLLIGCPIKYRGWTGLISETTAIITPGGEGTAATADVIGNVTLVVGFALLLGGLEAAGPAALLPGGVGAPGRIGRTDRSTNGPHARFEASFAGPYPVSLIRQRAGSDRRNVARSRGITGPRTHKYAQQVAKA